MTVAARLLAISVAWVAIQIGSGYLTHRMPAGWFRRDGWLFRCRGFEREGKLYRRVFRVHRWKDRLPEAGALFAGGFNKRRLASIGPADASSVLERFVAETRRAELTHWLPVLFSLSFFLWNPPAIAAWMPPIGLLGNLPFIIVQRSNRPRLTSLRRRAAGPERP